ncbi:hypothetical protein [Swingsia samuiensis]|uniref:Uncharacterized protein n=1 Tax=Swingsia samuiensis TaxID=1293412 RepID=A0A4Y6UIT2_9PROT|nr:hypothetical protein [Swingsia samuiensis]QDH16974.1 hypothetical protein E3D00_04915 [Swingsia samuiensis]
MLRQLDIPLPDFARDLHRVKALYDFLGGHQGGIVTPSFSPHPTMELKGQKGEGALQRKSTIFARNPDEYTP